MPRCARLRLPGMPWHIMQRGKNRSACFAVEENNRFSLDRLTELSQQFGGAVHVYALRTHPVHGLRTPERADRAPLTMKHLGQCYV